MSSLILSIVIVVLVWAMVRWFLPREPREGFDCFVYIFVDMATDLLCLFAIFGVELGSD